MQLSTNYGLKLPEGTDNVKRQDFIDNFSKIDSVMKEHDTHLSDMVYQTAGGSATAITLAIKGTLVNGYPITFISSANNGGAATTISGKKLYKPGTTTSPSLISGKAYTVWYNSTGDCFFIKASAEGTALAKDVRKNTTFSNDNDTGITGGLDLSLLVPGNIRAGITVDGVTGKSSVVDTVDALATTSQLLSGTTAYVNGIKVTGNLPDLGASQHAPDTWTDGNGTLVFRVPSIGAFTSAVNGYKPELSTWDGNFVASNIISGKSILGVAGTTQQLHIADGSFSNAWSNNYATVNLGFQPKALVIKTSDGGCYMYTDKYGWMWTVYAGDKLTIGSQNIFGITSTGFNYLQNVTSGTYFAVG
ncbi:hypothetical protein [Clostridium beijerinckii]|uniref:hypothetical protein n=1 Tax=Clostridium beijerinckii TaxID=1520 RepID=UPI0006870FB6|nr:hypothetical protein [Clostridium beijerinckii]